MQGSTGEEEQTRGHLTDASIRRRNARAKRETGLFIRGPIPVPWVSIAAGVSDKSPTALSVGLAIWLQAGLTGREDGLVITGAVVAKICSVDRKTRYRALKALEQAGLVAVASRRGAAPRVTILRPR